MLCKDILQLARGQFDAFDQRGCGGPLFVASRIQRPAQRVIDRQQVAGQARAAILFGVAALFVSTLAGVFRVGQGAHEAVAIFVRSAMIASTSGEAASSASGSMNSSSSSGPPFGLFMVMSSSFPARDHPADKLRGIVDDWHDAPVIEPRRTNDANRAYNLRSAFI